MVSSRVHIRPLAATIHEYAYLAELLCPNIPRKERLPFCWLRPLSLAR